ncbi:hypothetical protein LAT59_00800 [Candidatus Gracilibacteria bacterium]|nr:hypothetical protein [Candidatus Gracilibacteria bacterium]
MNIKEKLSNIDDIILKKDFLLKLIDLSGKRYNIDDLVNLKYISVIKKGETYFNNMIPSFKDPYILGGAYMDFKDFMFAGFDMYNKAGFITQVSNIFTVYNLKYSKEGEIMGMRFKFKKVKKEFFYGKETKMMNSYKIHFMTKERLFLEYVRDYINYDDKIFVDIYNKLDKDILEKYLNKYPIKKVVNKINNIKTCS